MLVAFLKLFAESLREGHKNQYIFKKKGLIT